MMKLKKASESSVAAAVRSALDVGPEEPVGINVSSRPRDRPASAPQPQAAPPSAAGFDALKTASDERLRELGLRRWSRPESGEVAMQPTLLAGNPALWLFPVEWYNQIPDRYEIVDISWRASRFERGKTGWDAGFGCLAYGVLVRNES